MLRTPKEGSPLPFGEGYFRGYKSLIFSPPAKETMSIVDEEATSTNPVLPKI